MHVPFEGLGCIEQWIDRNGHSLGYTRFYDHYQLPEPDDFDWLIVMGGPMGVCDEAIYPWLAEEKAFVKQAIENGKTVIGICLGSQLIAEVLGAKVYPNKQKEIGWYNLQLSDEGKTLPIISDFENEFPVFHWHGDTFDLPAGSKRLFQSEITANQAFLYHNQVLGLQFHFEVTAETLLGMVENGREELIVNKAIQSAEQILQTTAYIENNNQLMFRLLDRLAE